MNAQPDTDPNDIITDEGDSHKYFHIMLNIADEDLDPYQYRLLGHYKRACGANNKPCTQGVRYIAQITRMSVGQVSETRQQLANEGWIRLRSYGKQGGFSVTIIDRWLENVERCRKRSQHEQSSDTRSPDEQGVHDMNSPAEEDRSPDEPKKNVIKNINKKNNLGATAAPAGKPSTSSIRRASSKSKKPIEGEEKSERPRDPIFDAVAEHIFETDPKEVNGDGGRIGRISHWLDGSSDRIRYGRRNIVFGFISRPATPQHIKKFAEDWKKKNSGTNLPLDAEKFVEHWRAWASSLTSKNGNHESVALDTEYADVVKMLATRQQFTDEEMVRIDEYYAKKYPDTKERVT